MANSIVTVNVSQQLAPTPSKLQKTGALISQGATNLAAGASALLTQLSDLTPLLNGAITLTSLAWSSGAGGTVTGSTSSNHNIAVGQEFTIAGSTPTAYNGTFVALAGTTGNIIKYALTPNPGVATVLGTLVNQDIAELLAMATTFFAQGSQQGVYVLELGAGSPADGVAALAAYIASNPGVYYAYLVPREWASEATYLTFLAGFESTTSKTYFFTTMTLGNYASFTAAMKCVLGLVEAPAIPVTEFSLAAAFWRALNYDPSSTNRVTPFAFGFLFGVTAYPIKGNGATLAALKAASVNYVGTGAEGGVSNTILFWGTVMDGKAFNYWYSVDWVQINVDLRVTDAVINGSNDPINPLYYNQDGINRLQSVAAAVMSDGVAFGLVLGPPIQTALDPNALGTAIENGDFDGKTDVNAVTFVFYVGQNPSDYPAGRYAGLTIVYTPAQGFTAIVFNVLVSQFAAGG